MDTIVNNFKFRTTCLSGSTLKIIACVIMFFDHFSASCMMKYMEYLLPIVPYSQFKIIYELHETMRAFGRIAFPIFCFLLVEGYMHTSNPKRYALRLFGFAIISEVFFDLALYGTYFYPKHQNVYFTLFLGLICIWAIDTVQKKVKSFPGGLLLISSALIGCYYLSILLKTDYSYKGIAAIVIMYVFYSQFPFTFLALCPFYYAPYAFFSAIPIYLYNGKRGLKTKYFFYVFYPLHLFILYLISRYVIPS